MRDEGIDEFWEPTGEFPELMDEYSAPIDECAGLIDQFFGTDR